MDTPNPLSPRLSYAGGACGVPLLGETIGQNLHATVERHGDREALVVRHQRYRATYREFWDATTRAALGLLALGVAKGDRVGIWSPNRFEWPVVQYATARIGAILVNVNPAYRAGELAYVLRQAGVSVLFLARCYRGMEYAPILAAARPQCPELRHALIFDDAWHGFLADGEPVSVAALAERESSLQCDDPINIQYTSGTTGRPKGATLTHHNILNNAYFVGRELGYGPDDRVCIPVPFYHCFGMVLGALACTAHAACMVLPSESFDPRAVLETVQAERCTSLYGVPTMFHAMLEQPRFGSYDVTSLRTGIVAGAPCPVELMRQVVTKLNMREVAIGYGMTETSPISTLTARDDSLDRRVGTVGRVQPHVEVKVIDPAGEVVPRGQPGEFCARGYHVMRGYWDDPDATNACIDEAHWMHSGDLAVMDDEGYVQIVGRIKDTIIRAGENIAPREIEELVLSHPAVGEVQVIGVSDVKYGEELMAWVKLRPGQSACEDELRRFCTARIAAFKVPRYWKFVTEFPLTVTGKVQKYRLREQASRELGLA